MLTTDPDKIRFRLTPGLIFAPQYGVSRADAPLRFPTRANGPNWNHGGQLGFQSRGAGEHARE
jgi:hypothetical protein